MKELTYGAILIPKHSTTEDELGLLNLWTPLEIEREMMMERVVLAEWVKYRVHVATYI